MYPTPRVNNLGQTFEVWKRLVNNECWKIANVNCDDIPDYDYYAYFVENFDPTTTAREALAEAGFPFEEGEVK